MALSGKSTFDGVGFNKKHDAPGSMQTISPARHSWIGLRRRRLIFVLVALLILLLFIKNIPTDVVPVSERYDRRYGSMAPGHVQAQLGNHEGHVTSPKQPTPNQKHDESIKFENLAASLRPHISRSRTNNNVLFALPEFRSTASLIPIACQMARNNRSSVHVVLLGRQNIELGEILKMNSIPADYCPIHWHDARPDRPLESSHERIQESIRSGLGHTCAALRPQVILVDEACKESAVGYLLQEVALSIDTTLIDLPGNTLQSLPWLTSLDISSLQSFNSIEIDIIIQAYSESAGPLIRLLRSIQHADYNGLSYPRLTIELPAQVDPFLLSYLESMQWPPGSVPSQSLLTLRHRVQRKMPNVVEASMQVIESFYPRKASTSHVLLLSSDAELAPSYLHYLMLTLLEYKYGIAHHGLSELLFGIALELPTTRLDGRAPFVQQFDSDMAPFIMMQSPNSNGALFMGDKWVDLHTFIAHRLEQDANLAKSTDASASITKEYPHWLREALDLMLTQGQYMLYPAFADKEDWKLMAVHHELHQTPEEYVQANVVETDVLESLGIEQILRNDVLTNDPKLPKSRERTALNYPSLPLQQLLTSGENRGVPNPPLLRDLPLFTYSGERTDWTATSKSTMTFADAFSLQQGGCKSLDDRNSAEHSRIDHLFCGVK